MKFNVFYSTFTNVFILFTFFTFFTFFYFNLNFFLHLWSRALWQGSGTEVGGADVE